MSAPRIPIKDRFWDKVEKTDECWNWVGAKGPQGYGLIQAGAPGRKLLRAHRVAYQLLKGDIPDGKHLDHMCHNRACVNPDHLRPVTDKQNGENRADVRSASGVRNVYWHKQGKCWTVKLRHNRKDIYGGLFKDLAEAESAARELRNQYFTHHIEAL